MKAIGIDIGTTSVCAVLLDSESGKIEKTISENSNAFIPTKNEWEKIQDVNKIENLVYKMVDDLYTDEVDVIGFTGQMHGIVYFDKNLKAVSNLYTWQDQRGNLVYKDSITYSNHLGIPAGYGYVTDFYNEKNGLKPKDAYGFTTIHSYMAMRLSQSKSCYIHSSDAMSLGNFDIKENKFNFATPLKVTNDFTIIGKYKNADVTVAIGDNQASVYATLKDTDTVIVNFGTGSQVSVISDKIVNEVNIETRPYFNGKYLLVGCALCGGRAYAILEKFFSDIIYMYLGKRVSMYEFLNNLPCEDSPLLVDTRFSGTRSNDKITGGISSITDTNLTPQNLKNAFLEGMARELFQMYEKMGVKAKNLVCSGNGVRKNKSLLNKIEKMFNLKSSIPLYKEEAAIGSALFALCAKGIDAKNLIKYEV